MGGGASSASGGCPKTRDDRSSDTSTTCGTDAGSNGMCQQWLMSTIEKERKEKEWLAHKYDERCAEVLALQEEVRALRAKVQPSCSTPLCSPTAGSEAVRDGSTPGLAKRRSLTLNVQTGKHAPSVKLAQDRPDEADETDKAAPQWTASTTADGVEAEACPGVLSHVSYDFREPTKEGPEVAKTKSQLLRRRTGLDGEAGTAVDRAGSAELGITAADKIFSMVDNPEEEPLSPKRSSGGRAARGRRGASFEEDLRPEEL
jgi:hypothetical protein